MDIERIKNFIEIKKEKKILHCGCQDKYIDGAINIDYVNFPNVDKIVDLNKKLPFSNNSIDGIIAIHVIEHLDYFHFMNEILRILKSGGRAYFVVPHFANHRAHIGEHKVPGFSWVAFEHFMDPNHPFHGLKVISNKIKFGKKLKFLDKIFNKIPLFYERFLCYLLPATEVEVVLEKRKGKVKYSIKI